MAKRSRSRSRGLGGTRADHLEDQRTALHSVEARVRTLEAATARQDCPRAFDAYTNTVVLWGVYNANKHYTNEATRHSEAYEGSENAVHNRYFEAKRNFSQACIRPRLRDR